MKLYQINYDLRKQRDYEALYDRIKSYGTWCRALESCWVVATDQTAAQVRDYLAEAMDKDDGLFVSRMKGDAAWRNLSPQVSEWLKSQLERQPA